ncbi:hypothetical protein DM02DRAFT_370459 [Periconia macrospinosa]|uniref:DUF590-domain-containing protein n=1 Tax=Periconia macrospinosa TaxID=97972 RepID=A0A2V1DSG5_9PLEO|nr:hypothetical protein DM02DRAFT_370459 [Periconia macrospinosa]
MQLRRADTALVDDVTSAHIAYNDKYVVVYDFRQVDADVAIAEFTQLLQDLESTGLHTEVRAGYDESLLVFIQAPRELLGNMVYHSRVMDWLYGITKQHPGGNKDTVAVAHYEAEDLLSALHLVTWRKEQGGAAITPGFGKWENVTSVFPLHNPRRNRELLIHLSKRLFLTSNDLDWIRDIWGSKVAFYFAFIQAYFLSLAFPCVVGILAWAFLPKYSLVFALIIGMWCTAFLEYWKLREVDLSIRWNVRGVNKLKKNRPQYYWEKEEIDEAGRTRHVFPPWKRVVRQLAVVPFLFMSTAFLVLVIGGIFLLETLIGEGYDGAYDSYLEYAPTIVLAILLPFINTRLESIAEKLTEYENHRTQDAFEMSLTQKKFVLQSITNYLPIFLAAYLYVPFGDKIIPRLRALILPYFGVTPNPDFSFSLDPDRLRNEVITLTITGQVLGAIEELAFPWLKNKAKEYWRVYRTSLTLTGFSKVGWRKGDDPVEARFLTRVRKQALLPSYDVQEDYAELVLQWGYLALFSPVWPLVPIGFFINNWFELRADIVKICLESQRPDPIRGEGIGPWIGSLEALTWLGSLNSAALVHLFGNDMVWGAGKWWSLPITIFISEHIYLGFRVAVRWALEVIGSKHIRAERAERYAERKKYLDEMEASETKKGHLNVMERERRKSIRMTAADVFWTRQAEEGASAKSGVGIIRALKDRDVVDEGILKKME